MESSGVEPTPTPGKRKYTLRPVDIGQLDIRVGMIDAVLPHPTFTKSCFVADTNIGQPKRRMIPSEANKHFDEEDLDEKLLLVVCNLPKLWVLGFETHTMFLWAFSPDKENVDLLLPPRGAKVGERVVVEGYTRSNDPYKIIGKTIFQKVAADWTVNSDKQVVYKGVPLITEISNGFITTKSLTGCSINYM